VPLYLDYGTTGLWLNPAAFAVPANGTLGRPQGVVKVPPLLDHHLRLFQ
jgi:hypothetical protein